MSRVRLLILVVLFLAPPLFMMSMGAYHLWAAGHGFLAWWPMALCMATGYLLLYRWTRSKKYLLPDTGTDPLEYWTDRDRAAWKKVHAKAESYLSISPMQLSDPQHYAKVSVDLLQQVGELYNPGQENPVGHLTIPELLSCVELAASDLHAKVEKYLPGSHMFRINDIRMAQKAMDWYQKGRSAYWLAAGMFNPVKAGIQYAAARFGLGTMFDRVQGNVLLWLHTAYIHELGRYLIELNSGRLKVGTLRYRELLASHREPPIETEPAASGEAMPPSSNEASEHPPAKGAVIRVGVAVLGQVKAGKSSLINALIGEAKATVDALPVEHTGTKYRLGLRGGGSVELLDTRGYGQEGPSEAEFEDAVTAACDADLILLVVPARNPARKQDLDLLDRLRTWFASRPALRMPPVVAAVNQIDQLTPAAEWKPPYDWRSGARPKEANIRDCVLAVRETFGPRIVDAVPVCALEKECTGIAEELTPALATQLTDARGAALLRVFHAEGAADRYQKLGSQLLEGGKQAIKVLWENWKK